MSRSKSVALSALAAVVLVPAGAAAAASAKAAPQALNGTWVSTITLQNPPPGLTPTFQALDTFTADGAVLVTSSQSLPATRSLAHGTWTRTGDRAYASTFVWFRFDATGAFVGWQRVRRQMKLSANGKAFQATDTIDVIAPDGSTVVATLHGTETGVRLAV